MAKKRGRGGAPLFIVLTTVLLLALFLFGLNALNKSETYHYQASITPTPSATPRRVAVTRDPAAPTISPAPTALLFQMGAKGESVTELQTRLKALGYYQSDIDGQYGSGTKEAVTQFQKQHGLDADGIVGEKTYMLLFSDAAEQMKATPAPKTTDVLSGAVPLLVNRTHTLDEDFKPDGLVYLNQVCDSALVKIKGSEIQGVKTAVDALITMLEAAKAEGVTNWQISAGYRSYQYQKQLFDASVKKFMDQGSTKKSATSSTRLTVADPGASEHHTGLAFDVTVPDRTFADTKQCAWLHEHCWEYGFIVRYQKDKEKLTGFVAEAWHIRYVGLPHSTYMRENNLCLEEYVDYLAR